METLPETILQFGAGKFFRAFADLLIHQANEQGQNVGRIVVVQSTGDDRAGLLNSQKGRYHVLIRGLSEGQTVDRVEESASISRALVATQQWDDIVALARSPQLRYIISNTTEVGYNLDPTDTVTSRPPRSFPAKLLLILQERFKAGRAGVTIIPCELFERNGEKLRDLTLDLATSWHLPESFKQWLRSECVWLDTLVDRIVAARPTEHPLLATDALLTVAEPYALWAIQLKDGAGPFIRHPAVVRTPDVQPYFLRKVRILNAAHTAMVGKARARGILTVREAVLDAEIGDWLGCLLFEEVVPTVADRVDDAAGFARLTLERFRNPFIEHKFSDIAMYHEAKVKIRLRTTREEYTAKFGHPPKLLDEAIVSAT
ncbi:MAG: tagaturonate reductase [Gemmataceae bacterium]|nr:tagaturonate reductase [Gemmataceae bacterium]